SSRVKISVKVDTIGVRPAGGLPDSAFIVRTAISAGKSLGFTAPTGASSTDANFPMSLGIAAITIDGGGDGRGAHATSDSYDAGDRVWLGPQWAALIVAMLAQARCPADPKLQRRSLFLRYASAPVIALVVATGRLVAQDTTAAPKSAPPPLGPRCNGETI